MKTLKKVLALLAKLIERLNIELSDPKDGLK